MGVQTMATKKRATQRQLFNQEPIFRQAFECGRFFFDSSETTAIVKCRHNLMGDSMQDAHTT